MEVFLMHHGIKGQKWGERRFQNEDGSLTPAGKERYNQGQPSYNIKKKGLSDKQKTALKIAGGVAGAAALVGGSYLIGKKAKEWNVKEGKKQIRNEAILKNYFTNKAYEAEMDSRRFRMKYLDAEENHLFDGDKYGIKKNILDNANRYDKYATAFVKLMNKHDANIKTINEISNSENGLKSAKRFVKYLLTKENNYY